MTPGFLKTLESIIIYTPTGIWRIKASAHQGGASVEIIPDHRPEDSHVLRLILYVHDEDEQYTDGLERAIGKWIGELTIRPPVATFNPSNETLESWQVRLPN
jgi:hypothetical protein